MKKTLFIIIAAAWLVACDPGEVVTPATPPDNPDAPDNCEIATMVVSEETGRFFITSQDTSVHYRFPYDYYCLNAVLEEEFYDCLGFIRLPNEDQVITIWDSRDTCVFIIPRLPAAL